MCCRVWILRLSVMARARGEEGFSKRMSCHRLSLVGRRGLRGDELGTAPNNGLVLMSHVSPALSAWLGLLLSAVSNLCQTFPESQGMLWHVLTC